MVCYIMYIYNTNIFYNTLFCTHGTIDCYLEETVQGIAFSEFMNTGQVCCSGSRLLIQRDIAPKFIKKLVEFVKEGYSKGIGDPLQQVR